MRYVKPIMSRLRWNSLRFLFSGSQRSKRNLLTAGRSSCGGLKAEKRVK
jgi:hypothetical protein